MKHVLVSTIFFALHLLVLGYMACGDELEPTATHEQPWSTP